MGGGAPLWLSLWLCAPVARWMDVAIPEADRQVCWELDVDVVAPRHFACPPGRLFLSVKVKRQFLTDQVPLSE